MESFARRLGPVGIVIATVIVAVVVNLIIYAIGSVAGANYDFTADGESYNVTPLTLIGFTAIPLLIGLIVTVILSRWRRWVILVALVIAPLAAIGTIFTMTIPSDLDTGSKVALVAAHIALGIVAVGGILALRTLETRSTS